MLSNIETRNIAHNIRAETWLPKNKYKQQLVGC